MKVQLKKKNLKKLNESNQLANQATPQVAGGGTEYSVFPQCRPSNPVICYTEGGWHGCVPK
ncbi:hypothetical protein [Pseudoalteromonas luteoviolacea]|uniref:Class I lanthipeptide n=1 Tax=Pseudoalteromonas luteoviolacea S4060-1 TaxID=1365257 RepID=A0A167NZ00_9GAMM|nr:hypothetical protein [Pseudoalteromonas luteoviolacea]KZN38745.1 hypothetical protein N480_13905 [Pseudoalteromonas luteoviolacea S2607]KZN69179.1 hypothetical protein N478_11140 [Pseudoalteromonas luteoviolacea S4060-1]